VAQIDLFAIAPDGEDVTDVIVAALDRPPGDVVLIEVQTRLPAPYEDLLGPVEAHEPIFEAIAAATAAGVVVIEVGGNGTAGPTGEGGRAPALDMDAIELDTPRGRARIFDRTYRDSGAIVVSASTAKPAPRRLKSAPHGRRVDLFAWGERVFAPHASGGRTTGYRNDFGGTSAAAAIVAGAALALQSLAETELGHPLDNRQLRRLLATGGTRPAKGERPIGVMPNLRAATQMLLAEAEGRPVS
jgi:hypothetical protein